jgi:hypothetical protein
MAESTANGIGESWTLPEKWSEDLVDEKGEKMSKRCVFHLDMFNRMED